MQVLEPKSQYQLHAPAGSTLRMGLLAAYDLSISIGDIRIEIGRFSQPTLGRIRVFSGVPAGSPEPTVSIGAFCEFAEGSLIIAGGEHRNKNIFNTTLGLAGSFYKVFMTAADLDLCQVKHAAGIRIGDGVIVSTNGVVLDGSRIGDGCLLGAGSLLAGEAHPFGVYLGTPAKRFRERLSPAEQDKYRQIDFANVAAHAVPRLPSTALAYQRGDISQQEMRALLPLLSARPTLHAVAALNADRSIGTLDIKSFSVGSEAVEDQAKIARLHRYFQQFSAADETVQWVPDVFYALGLVSQAS